MILSHFSQVPLQFDPNKDYSEDVFTGKNYPIGKPKGLWLSNEAGERTWKDFCENEGFNTHKLSVENLFLCDTKDWAVLSSYDDIKYFGKEYKFWIAELSPYFHCLDWVKIKKDFKGLLISPFNYKAHYEFMWYYGWDCDSACVWDLSTVSPYRG